VMKGPGVSEVQEFPRPEVEPGAVLMQVLYSGICGTDKHTFRGETVQYAGTPHERRLEYPIVCGHENVGVVVETGGDVPDSAGRPLRPGDRIVPGANVACGECWFCREGFPYYACERLEDYGNSLNAKRPPHLFAGWAELTYGLPGWGGGRGGRDDRRGSDRPRRGRRGVARGDRRPRCRPGRRLFRRRGHVRRRAGDGALGRDGDRGGSIRRPRPRSRQSEPRH